MFTTISFPPLHMTVLSLSKSYGNMSRDSWVHEHIAYPEFPCFFLVPNTSYVIFYPVFNLWKSSSSPILHSQISVGKSSPIGMHWCTLFIYAYS